MATPNNQKFFDIVARQKVVRSRSGYVNDADAERWRLHGRAIDFGDLSDSVTPDFQAFIKQTFADLVNAKQSDDGTISTWFIALKDLLHFVWRSTGDPVDGLTDAMIDAWRVEASGKNYPGFLKVFMINSRKRNKSAFSKVSDDILKKLKKTPADIEHILALDPHKGPWLEKEILDQDLAIEKAYTSGVWHVEKYVLVQLFRLYGMRTSQLCLMKIEDVRLRLLGHERDEIRWPYVKNDQRPDQALWWPLGGVLLPAMMAYLEERLKGIPKDQWGRLPLFTPEGIPGVWGGSGGTRVEPSRELGYEGHAMPNTLSTRFVRTMKSLELVSARTGAPEPMHFGPHRERHTVGVRLALKGYSASMIALRLGHKNSASCNAYVDLARLAMQLRNPKFYHLMDDVGAVFTNTVSTRAEIDADLAPIISVEATTEDEVALIGGGRCGSCMFAGEASSGEPWPCLSCPQFQLYEDADLQPLWDILQERKAYMHYEDGSWNFRFDPDIRAQFDRYEALLIGAETRRREVLEERRNLGEAA